MSPTVAHQLISLHQSPAPPMDVVMVFGFVTAVFTLACFIYQRESRRMTMAVAVCMAGMSVFGFLEGMWPLGLVVFAVSAETFNRWRNFSRPAQRARSSLWNAEARVGRMFGSGRWN